MISENRKKGSKKSRNSCSQGVPTAMIYVIKNDNNNLQKCKVNNGKNFQGKSAFNRNNKLQLLRHAPKRTILNQPSARMMINNNKKK